MAKLTQNVLGDISGTVGNVSFGSWKDLNIVKAKRGPSSTPPTEAQQLVQEKFRELSRLGKAFFNIVKVGMAGAATGATEQNLFMSSSYPSVSGALGALVIDYSKLIISKGTLEKLNGPAVASSGGMVNLSWAYLNFGDGNDTIVAIAYNPEINQTFIQQDKKRSDNLCVLAVPANWFGKTVHVYLFAKNPDENVSDSQYAGSATVTA